MDFISFITTGARRKPWCVSFFLLFLRSAHLFCSVFSIEFLELIQSLISQAPKTCVLSAFQNGENLPKLAENEKLGTLVTRESQLLRGSRLLEQSSSSNDPPAARKFSKKNYMETLTTGKAHFVSAIFLLYFAVKLLIYKHYYFLSNSNHLLLYK